MPTPTSKHVHCFQPGSLCTQLSHEYPAASMFDKNLVIVPEVTSYLRNNCCRSCRYDDQRIRFNILVPGRVYSDGFPHRMGDLGHEYVRIFDSDLRAYAHCIVHALLPSRLDAH